LVCVVVLAGVIGFFHSHGAIPGVMAGQPASLSTGQAAPNATQSFQVEVVDVNNKRWILSNDKEVAPSQVSSPGNSVASPPVIASAPLASPPAIATPRKRDLQLSLRTPLAVKRQPLAERQDVAIADNLVLPDSSIDPRSLAVGSSNPARPPQPAADPEPVRQPSGLQEAVLIKRVEPTYPAVARQLHIEGTVQVQAAIDKDGLPHELKAVSGNSRLTESALSAVRQWRFKPAQLDGQAVEASIIINVQFRLAAN